MKETEKPATRKVPCAVAAVKGGPVSRVPGGVTGGSMWKEHTMQWE